MPAPQATGPWARSQARSRWAFVSCAPGDGFFSLEAFQLTTKELLNFLALQCIFEGAAVRVFLASATPLMLLVLLLACCFLEIFLKGTGHLAVKGSDTSKRFFRNELLLCAFVHCCNFRLYNYIWGDASRAVIQCLHLRLRNSDWAEDPHVPLHRWRGWGCQTAPLRAGGWFRPNRVFEDMSHAGLLEMHRVQRMDCGFCQAESLWVTSPFGLSCLI